MRFKSVYMKNKSKRLYANRYKRMRDGTTRTQSFVLTSGIRKTKTGTRKDACCLYERSKGVRAPGLISCGEKLKGVYSLLRRYRGLSFFCFIVGSIILWRGLFEHYCAYSTNSQIKDYYSKIEAVVENKWLIIKKPSQNNNNGILSIPAIHNFAE